MTTFQALPDATNKPVDAQPSTIRQLLVNPKTSRRRMLKMFAGAGVAMGLGFIGSIPLSRPRPAYAAAYEVWLDTCRGYFARSTVCEPVTAYFGSDTCDPGTTWHREGRVRKNSDVEIRYRHDPVSCAGRNAWVWAGEGRSTKCSDGQRWVERSSDGTDFKSFSICRTHVDDESPESPEPVLERGTYRVENVFYGTYLEAADRKVKHTDGRGADTHWKVTYNDEGFAALRNVDDRRRLRFSVETEQSELRAQTWGGNGERTQWTPTAGDTEGTFLLTNRKTGTTLTARRSNKLISASSNDGPKSQWRFIPV